MEPQAPRDITQELVGKTIKSIYTSDKEIRIHFENGLDVMILPKCMMRDFDGITPILTLKIINNKIIK